MDIHDLRLIGDHASLETDLCIVGSGPAGLALAGELIGSGLRILVVERGGRADTATAEPADPIESIGAPRVMDQSLLRDWLFGGTSNSWTGRCAPLSDLDFAQRDWVPHSGWPFARQSLDGVMERAGPYIGLGRTCYDERLRTLGGRPPPRAGFDAALLQDCFWQFGQDSADSLDFMRFGKAFLARRNAETRILLHATVTQLRTNANGSRLTGVEVTAPNGNRATIRAKAVVLCAGGIENPRILLTSRADSACGVGNQHGMVGRFLMDHPRCTLGEFDLRSAGEVRDRFGLFRVGDGNGGGNFFSAGVSLSPETQAREGLLNCAAWLTEHRAADDPWDATKRLVSGRARILPDAWSVLMQPRLMFRGARDRLVRGRGVTHKLDRLVLDCIVEQRPDPESRILLAENTDRFGLPLARLDWRISEQEKATVARLGQLIRAEFQRIGLAAPTLADWVAHHRLDQASFRDVAHPAGTTRIAENPRLGVVDANCQVHGVDGLFIAGSSVFPTVGYANPTLMIVALAIKLADHLKHHIFPTPHPAATAQTTTYQPAEMMTPGSA